MSKERYQFERDDSGHWYLIPTHLDRVWHKWLDEENEEEIRKYRINGPYSITFTDPKKE